MTHAIDIKRNLFRLVFHRFVGEGQIGGRAVKLAFDGLYMLHMVVSVNGAKFWMGRNRSCEEVRLARRWTDGESSIGEDERGAQLQRRFCTTLG